jgi:hypothetical protein
MPTVLTFRVGGIANMIEKKQTVTVEINIPSYTEEKANRKRALMSITEH